MVAHFHRLRTKLRHSFARWILSLVFVIIFIVGVLPGRRIDLQSSRGGSTEFSQYMNLTKRALHVSSLLRKVVDDFPTVRFPRQSEFPSVGLAASGHHLIMKLPPLVAFSQPPGWAKSFPSGGYQEFCADLHQVSMAIKSDTSAWEHPKYLILVRDPLLQFKSTIRRYWKVRSVPLPHMYDNWISAASQMQIFVNSLLAQNAPMMVLSYELLTAHPNLHKAPLAHFLGVSPAVLDTWIESIHPIQIWSMEDVEGFKECQWDWGRWRNRSCTDESLSRAFNDAFYSKNERANEKDYADTRLSSVFTWPNEHLLEPFLPSQ